MFAPRRFSNWARREDTGFCEGCQCEHPNVAHAGVTYDRRAIRVICLLVHFVFLLVSRHLRVYYNCSSTSGELFPLGAWAVR